MTDYLTNADDFDEVNIVTVFDEGSFWSSHFGTLLFNNLELRPNLNVLDVGCGTGFPLFELAHVLGSSCRVTGIDIWEAALEHAKKKLDVYKLPNVRILNVSANEMPFEDGEFDLLVSNVGVNNFDDATGALAECARVTKRGGQLAIMTNVRGHMVEFYDVFRDVLMDFGNADYLERLEVNEAHRGTRDSTCQLLEGAGFGIRKVVEDQLEMRYVDGSALLRHFLTRVGFLPAWRQVVDPRDEVEIFRAIEKGLNQIAADAGDLKMTVPMLYVEGERF
jgi:ubiquinone/menaquinone biosynthesis C-methylase UbiE